MLSFVFQLLIEIVFGTVAAAVTDSSNNDSSNNDDPGDKPESPRLN